MSLNPLKIQKSRLGHSNGQALSYPNEAPMDIVFAYEHLSEPYDEGVKKFAKMLHDALAEQHHVRVIRNPSSGNRLFCKLLLVPRIWRASAGSAASIVIYIPEGSVTFFGLLKLWLLRRLLGDRLRPIGTQRRVLAGWQQSVIRRLDMGLVYVISGAMSEDLKGMGIRTEVINAGIDVDKFSPSGEDVGGLRRKYGLAPDDEILLHVGHIKESRNLRWLLDISRASPQVQVVVVGSTATETDVSLLLELKQSGILVLDGYVAEVQELYQAASWYCFPVLDHSGAMEVPLSVLEAMAVGLPVIATRFGRLPELFQEDEGFRYVDSSHEAIGLLEAGFGRGRCNRNKVSGFTWRAVAASLLAPVAS